MFGYFLVHECPAKTVVSGMPEIKGTGESTYHSLVACVAGEIFGRLGTLGEGVVFGAQRASRCRSAAISGRWCSNVFRLKGDELHHRCLSQYGYAAGLARPLTRRWRVSWVWWEIGAQFRYTSFRLKRYLFAWCCSTIMYRIFNHEVALIDVGELSDAPLNTLWLYLQSSVLFLAFSALFLINGCSGMQFLLHVCTVAISTKWDLMGGAMAVVLISGVCGTSNFGRGLNLIPIATAGISAWECWCLSWSRGSYPPSLFLFRRAGRFVCPMLALGTVLGTAFGMVAVELFPQYHLRRGTYYCRNGGVLAASIRAPLTGIILVLEITDNYQLILPMILPVLAQRSGHRTRWGNRYTRRFLRARWQNRKLSDWPKQGRVGQREY
ncbi:chloride channel protein [Shigella flexneri]